MLNASATGQTRTVEVKISPGPAGTMTVAMKSEALPGTLAAMAGTLTVSGLDIVSAVILISSDGMVTDSFDVVPLDARQPGEIHAEKIAGYASGVLQGSVDISRDLGDIRRQRAAEPGIECSVEVNTDSELTTGIKVACPDRPGLLYDITSTLSRHGARVRALSVLTFSKQARDTFRVVDRLGKPFVHQDEIQAIRSELRRVCSA